MAARAALRGVRHGRHGGAAVIRPGERDVVL